MTSRIKEMTMADLWLLAAIVVTAACLWWVATSDSVFTVGFVSRDFCHCKAAE